MDPTAALQGMRSAMADADHELAREFALGLHQWLKRGGFPPQGVTMFDALMECFQVIQRTKYIAA